MSHFAGLLPPKSRFHAATSAWPCFPTPVSAGQTPAHTGAPESAGKCAGALFMGDLLTRNEPMDAHARSPSGVWWPCGVTARTASGGAWPPRSRAMADAARDAARSRELKREVEVTGLRQGRALSDADVGSPNERHCGLIAADSLRPPSRLGGLPAGLLSPRAFGVLELRRRPGVALDAGDAEANDLGVAAKDLGVTGAAVLGVATIDLGVTGAAGFGVGGAKNVDREVPAEGQSSCSFTLPTATVVRRAAESGCSSPSPSSTKALLRSRFSAASMHPSPAARRKVCLAC
mmetsp:Transcript_18687/g.51445  ORF Transcript_18687/g.51445 Transcript_18687/m.51445 type:complete len:290 (+) Transcript_18687:190-1059(+)